MKTKFFFRAAQIVGFLILLVYALTSAANIPYFQQFNTHLNKSAFFWADSPGFVLGLIFGNISYYGYLFLFILNVVVIYRIVKRIFSTAERDLAREKVNVLKICLSTLILIPLLAAGARGRLSDRSTTHEGLAIVCDNQFVNQVALNPNFTLFRSLFFQKVKEYKVPNDIDQSMAFTRNYLGLNGPYERSVHRLETSDSAFRPFNVVIVLMESMSSYKTGIHGRKNLTPRFNDIIRQSLYFDRFFSSGIHTFNGLFSTCTGFPGLLSEQTLRRGTKKSFPNLGNLLQQKGYDTYFYSTADPHFDNMKGFFSLNGYRNIYSALDLPTKKSISVTGVPDHEIFDLFFSTINSPERTKPFIGFIMTGSDHGPWVIPDDIPFKPDAKTQEERSTQYADWALGEFMKQAKQQTWYENTLFVFLGDHGYAQGDTYEMPLSYHHIPFVLHKPNTLKADTIHHLGYQPDVLSTVAGILNLSFENESFGSDIRKVKHPFVYFTADDKIGCVSDDAYFYYELISQKTKRLRKFENLDQANYYEEYRQKADSLELAAKSLLDVSEYLIRKDYFSY